MTFSRLKDIRRPIVTFISIIYITFIILYIFDRNKFIFEKTNSFEIGDTNELIYLECEHLSEG